ncbi:hypothetical protein LX36DRAFT_658643 [Colletotrichum falcatum]|nr:hypothetical protein LX36DRAFT_658643 [Colletotrichum falcatum]
MNRARTAPVSMLQREGGGVCRPTSMYEKRWRWRFGQLHVQPRRHYLPQPQARNTKADRRQGDSKRLGLLPSSVGAPVESPSTLPRGDITEKKGLLKALLPRGGKATHTAPIPNSPSRSAPPGRTRGCGAWYCGYRSRSQIADSTYSGAAGRMRSDTERLSAGCRVIPRIERRHWGPLLPA